MSFPKWIKKEHFHKINMPVLVLLGENEFAFSIKKAIRRAHLLIEKLDIDVIKDAFHLLSVSNSFCINQRVLDFLEDNKK